MRSVTPRSCSKLCASAFPDRSRQAAGTLVEVGWTPSAPGILVGRATPAPGRLGSIVDWENPRPSRQGGHPATASPSAAAIMTGARVGSACVPLPWATSGPDLWSSSLIAQSGSTNPSTTTDERRRTRPTDVHIRHRRTSRSTTDKCPWSRSAVTSGRRAPGLAQEDRCRREQRSDHHEHDAELGDLVLDDRVRR